MPNTPYYPFQGWVRLGWRVWSLRCCGNTPDECWQRLALEPDEDENGCPVTKAVIPTGKRPYRYRQR